MLITLKRMHPSFTTQSCQKTILLLELVFDLGPKFGDVEVLLLNAFYQLTERSGDLIGASQRVHLLGLDILVLCLGLILLQR